MAKVTLRCKKKIRLILVPLEENAKQKEISDGVSKLLC